MTRLLDVVMRRIDGGAVPDIDLTDGKPAFASLLVNEDTLAVLAQCCGTSAKNWEMVEQLLELGVVAGANDRRPRPRLRSVAS